MPRKRYTPEQIINKLREAEVLLSQGQTVAQASKQLGVSDQAYYRGEENSVDCEHHRYANSKILRKRMPG
jgi:hypothetical protein